MCIISQCTKYVLTLENEKNDLNDQMTFSLC